MVTGSDAKRRMVESALELFHAQGVNATSIDQILARSGTGKGQFTHYFKSKDGLIRAAIRFLDDAIRSGRTPTGYDLRSWKDFEGWFQKYIDFQKATECRKSCPLGTIGNDLTEEQEVVRQDVRLFLEWTRGKLARFFSERRAVGELPESADPEGLADLCISVMQGGMLLSKVKRDTDMFENAAAQVVRYVKSLRERRKSKR